MCIVLCTYRSFQSCKTMHRDCLLLYTCIGLPMHKDIFVMIKTAVQFAHTFPLTFWCLDDFPSLSPAYTVGVGGGMVRPASFKTRKGSLRGSLKGSFHGNRGNSFRGGSIRGHRGSMRGSFRVPKQGPGGGAPTRSHTSNAMMKQPKVETKMDISLFYQIYPEEILGSGQFGTVYGGMY